jgi:hypothetical protein
MSNQKNMRPLPVIAVEIRSPCATSLNHSRYVTLSSSRPNCRTASSREQLNKTTGRRAWYVPAGMSVPFQPSNLGIALCWGRSLLRLRPGNIVARGADKEDKVAG